ncbi:MAG: S4 domain-containing protein [Wenzhouxiangellaceae bacterium]|nr:S4 domain-containing protein [Wenzhouxiangellaceae bacterium]
MTEAVRIDKWLWAARFFKTRSQAQTAVRGGHVAINGATCKPARTLAVGDRLVIVRGESRFEIEVVELSDRRGPAVQAQALYHELPESIRHREALAEQRRLLRQGGPGRRPDKRERQRIRSFTGKD